MKHPIDYLKSIVYKKKFNTILSNTSVRKKHLRLILNKILNPENVRARSMHFLSIEHISYYMNCLV